MSGQIDLFTKRVRALPPPKEFRLHCAFVDTIKHAMMPGWRYTHLPFGEQRNAITGARLKRMGTQPGYPDFLFTGPHRGVFWLELKRQGGRFSDEQKDVAAHLMACGFNYHWTTNIEDAVGQLKDLGIVRVRVSA